MVIWIRHNRESEKDVLVMYASSRRSLVPARDRQVWHEEAIKDMERMCMSHASSDYLKKQQFKTWQTKGKGIRNEARKNEEDNYRGHSRTRASENLHRYLGLGRLNC